MEKFKELGLSKDILKVLKDKDFKEPTFIQEKCIPAVLEGKDVIGKSATGSGKTIAFGAALIQNLEHGKGVTGLVMTPTRELAIQVAEVLEELATFRDLRVATVYGGVSINPQINEIKYADIVVGTPGRILDHLQRNTLNLSKIKIAVLDEADRMLDMGFIDDVRKILSQTSNNRQTMLFSATINEEINKLKHTFMKDPLSVSVSSQVDPTKLLQSYYDVPQNKKLSILITLLNSEKSNSVIVFCNTRIIADMVSKNLLKNHFEAYAIHGGFTQAKRSLHLKKFQNSKAGILVCTDVAARGLDIKGVSHVYNYDIPNDSKDYIHRIGRTARAGSDGIAINILSPRDHDNFSRVMNEFPNMKVKKEPIPKLDENIIISMDRSEDNRSNGRGGSRGGGPKRFGSRNGTNRRSSDDNRRGDRESRPSNQSRDSRPRRFDRGSSDNRSSDRESRPTTHNREGGPRRFERSSTESRDRESRPSNSSRDSRPRRFERSGSESRSSDRESRPTTHNRETSPRRFERSSSDDKPRFGSAPRRNSRDNNSGESRPKRFGKPSGDSTPNSKQRRTQKRASERK